MANMIKKLRYRIAYWLASDWIDDLESRLCEFLCEQTGGVLSKPNYSVKTMLYYADYHRQRECDACEYYLKCEKTEEVEE